MNDFHLTFKVHQWRDFCELSQLKVKITSFTELVFLLIGIVGFLQKPKRPIDEACITDYLQFDASYIHWRI